MKGIEARQRDRDRVDEPDKDKIPTLGEEVFPTLGKNHAQVVQTYFTYTDFFSGWDHASLLRYRHRPLSCPVAMTGGTSGLPGLCPEHDPGRRTVSQLTDSMIVLSDPSKQARS
jgi:hypothetical protein